MWPIGTKRLLNVVGMAQSYFDIVDKLPPVVAKLVLRGAPGDINVFGDYEVCCFSKDILGHMHPVCINQAVAPYRSNFSRSFDKPSEAG